MGGTTVEVGVESQPISHKLTAQVTEELMIMVRDVTQVDAEAGGGSLWGCGGGNGVTAGDHTGNNHNNTRITVTPRGQCQCSSY